jgi:glutamate racemase
MRIGIFDSGIGGKAVANTLAKLLPSAEIISINDHDHMPYGNRKPGEIIKLTKKAILPLLNLECDAIIIACNTATTVAISALRQSYPGVNFIGIEPMIKPAATLTKTNCIAVFSTPSTLQSDRYKKLKRDWAKGIKIIEPDCSDWAELIENNRSEEIDVISAIKLLSNNNVDVIVLGCTHYHWIKQRIVDTAGPKVTILEPSDAISERVKNLVG